MCTVMHGSQEIGGLPVFVVGKLVPVTRPVSHYLHYNQERDEFVRAARDRYLLIVIGTCDVISVARGRIKVIIGIC